MAKQKESRQKKMDVRVDQTADHEPDHAEQRQECDG